MKTPVFILLFLIITGMAISAKTIDLPAEKIHLNIPDTWTSTGPANGVVFSARDAQSTSVAVLMSFPNEREDGLDESSFVSGIKEGFTNRIKNQGMTVTISTEVNTIINDVSFYSFQRTYGLVGGQPTTFQVYVTAANKKIYMLSLQSLQTNPNADFQGIANSLTFQTPPVLPDPNRPKSQSERIGYLVGKGIGILLALVVFGKILSMIVFKKFKTP